MKQKTRWLRLDNAAKIYPAVRSETWSNVFRVSATLSEPVDIPTAQSALDVTVRRFPSLAARLRRGLFWYYLEPVEQPPEILPEYSYPLTGMHRKEMRRCALRVLVYQNRLAVELFHSLTDGNGAMIFLKTLLAEYLQQRYAVAIPATHGILVRREAPKDEELEDSFQRYAGPLQASRKSNNAWRLSGTPEKDGFKNLTCFRLDATEALRKAHEHKVSLTTFLCAVMMTALQDMQSRSVPYPMWRKSIKLHVPVDLRRMFESKSLRNFVLYATPEIQPRLGHYTFDEICKTVHHQLGVEITPKKMGMLIATNLYAEKLMAVRMMPLFLKNIAMRAVFNAVGERKSRLSLSNLGAITVPEEMKPYIRRFDFVLGVQATSPYNCGVLSYNGELCINFIRSTKEPELELAFHRALQALGLTAPSRATNRKNKGEGSMYCIQCGVKLSDTEKRCPLCHTRVYHPDLTVEHGEKPYPAGKFPEVQPRSFLAPVLLTVLFLLPMIVVAQCDLLLNGQVTWSGFVIGALGFLYVTLVLPIWFRRPNPVIFVPCGFAALAVYLLYIDLAVQGNWFWTLALPVSAGVCLIVTAVVALIRYVKKGYLYIFGGACIALGALMLGVEFLLEMTFDIGRFMGWSLYPLTALVLLGGFLIFLAINRPARETMERKLFL